MNNTNGRTGRLSSIESTTLLPQTNTWPEVTMNTFGDGSLLTVPAVRTNAQQ